MNAIEMIVSLHSAKSQRLCNTSNKKNKSKPISKDVLIASLSVALNNKEHRVGYDAIKAKYLDDLQAAIRIANELLARSSSLAEPLKCIAISEALSLFCEVVPPSHKSHVMSLYRAYGALSNHYKYQRKLLTKRLKKAESMEDVDTITLLTKQLQTLKSNTEASISKRVEKTNKCPRCSGVGRISAGLYQCPSCAGNGRIGYEQKILRRYIKNQGITVSSSELSHVALFIDESVRDLDFKVFLAAKAIKEQKIKERECD
ncbi:hypothetical protein [Photobacterium damselae]|uniref:hypothetical protein n=1 Tax=Photobacterium damselae TaxID=38293 RepID=UPI0030F3FA01